MSIATYSHVPSSPWSVPTLNAHPRIFFTPTRLARFRALWASPTTNFTQLKSQITADTNPMSRMVVYMATRLTDPTGALNQLTIAYNAQIGQTFSVARSVNSLYADISAFIFDWGYADLSGAQKTALIAQLESFNSQRESTGNNGMLAGIGQEQGYTGYTMGVLAIEGESGATSRLTTLRNMVQNVANWMDEGMGDGHWGAYTHQAAYFLTGVYLPFHIAGNIENLAISRCDFARNRASFLSYRCTSGGWNMYGAPSDNRVLGNITTNAAPLQDGTLESAKPEMGFQYAMYADVLGDGIAQTMANAVSNQSASFKWTTGVDSQTTFPAYMAFIFYNSGITATAQSTLPNSAIFPRPGHVAFRSGWTTPTTSVRGWLYSAPHFSLSHDTHYAGCLEITRGDAPLICNTYTYAGQPSAWQNGNQTAGEVGTYSMCKSTVLFSPTGSATPDRSGSQKHVSPAGSAAAYPIANGLASNSTWLAGTVGSFTGGTSTAPGAKTQGTATYTNAYYPNDIVTSVNRVVAYVNGADEAHGTFFVQDNFTTVPSAVDRIRALWGCRAKPVGMTGETIVTGASLAGVMTYPNQKVTIQWRGSQAVIQMVSPTPTVLRLVGGGNGVAGAPAGPGYESYYDGSNLDFNSNVLFKNIPALQNRINGVWRIEHETTPAAANGQMLFAITVGAAGDVAPTYTQAQVLAIISGSGGGVPTMPGFTQATQRSMLDTEFSATRYNMLFSTVPNDDGTGGTELTGNGYARIAVLSTDWAAATGGSPASKSNAITKAFAAASGGDWLPAYGFGFSDASTGGNLHLSDYMGNFTWEPFFCTSASPGNLRSAAHGLTTGDKVLVTNKYGGALPTTSGSWSGIKTVTVVDVDNFSVGVDTTSTGDGQFRKVVPITVTNGQTWTWGVGDLKVTQG